MSLSLDNQKLYLLGAGNVGTELLKKLHEQGLGEVIAGIIGRDRYFIPQLDFKEQKSISPEDLSKLIKGGKDGGKYLLKTQGEEVSNPARFTLEQISRYNNPQNSIIADTSSWARGGQDDPTQFYLDILEKGIHIATSNKNPFTGSADDYRNIFSFFPEDGGRCLHNTTVMAGGPAIQEIRKMKEQGEEIESIEGCFSGTLGYIASELEKGKLLSEILKEAVEAGYTEPNPWDDLNGFDVARKLLILAREAGYNVEMDDIEVESFIPQEYGKYGKDELLEKVKELDEEYKKSYEEANAKGNTIKYVASLEKKEEGVELKVGLQEIPLNSPIGNLQGTSNIVVIGTNEHYRKNLGKEVVIKRPGAGVLTADGVASDIKEILRMNAYASRYV